jgi:hypothetical protein
MSSRAAAVSALVTVALSLTLAACGDAGNLSVVNEGTSDVTVVFGDERETVSAGGGVAFLDYGCTPGDVTVELASGRSVVVPGPVCPEQEIVVGDDGTVDVRPATALRS